MSKGEGPVAGRRCAPLKLPVPRVAARDEQRGMARAFSFRAGTRETEIRTARSAALPGWERREVSRRLGDEREFTDEFKSGASKANPRSRNAADEIQGEHFPTPRLNVNGQ